jgi:polyhydroxybutyrate depolymerase
MPRHYRLHVPKDYSDTSEQALILNFHGHGSTASMQERITGMSRLADNQDFIVAYPQGTIGPDGHTGWNTGPQNYPHVNDVQFTSDLLDHLQATLCIDPLQIYATGFSNGGSMTNVLACKLAGRIRAFAIVSGGIHPVAGGCQPARPVSLLEIHGTRDHVVPYGGNPSNDEEPAIQQWLADWAKRDNCAPHPTTFFVRTGVQGEQWTACKNQATIIHYRIQGGTHVWPPGNALHRKRHEPLNATAVIWQFFQINGAH